MSAGRGWLSPNWQRGKAAELTSAQATKHAVGTYNRTSGFTKGSAIWLAAGPRTTRTALEYRRGVLEHPAQGPITLYEVMPQSRERMQADNPIERVGEIPVDCKHSAP